MTDKSIFQKMFIKPGMKMLVLNLPPELTALIKATPPEVIMTDRPEKKPGCDPVVCPFPGGA
jgi:hypothetical protein